ncbi:unnamed protein product [Acanthoscelides obtectus]|uniref:Uncharacterized protein n=1 Tax=Acanthoscelides obtectus TaxID=200917 RepID=A0A9P0PP07_ACAOB|nr:unnamed protein product [Acanthoscelides obtectus]CAK1635496.1 hypothetical protein AOBTE_LOCUS9308 [Acanthoscelides obtectus]
MLRVVTSFPLKHVSKRRICPKKNVDLRILRLENTIKELGLENKPSDIRNLDESSSDPSKTKIVGQRGLPTTQTTSGPGKQNTTAVMPST